MASEKREVFQKIVSESCLFCYYEGIDKRVRIYHLRDDVYLYKASTNHKSFKVPSRKFKFTAEGETPEQLLAGLEKVRSKQPESVDHKLCRY